MSKPKRAVIGFIRESFMVRRYHTVSHVQKEETIGHHTANVVALLFYLFNDNPPLYLVRHALHHDVAENVTGDIPATAKWRFPALAKASVEAEAQVCAAMNLETAELDPLHRDLLKYADMMDLCFKAVEELAFGNAAFGRVLENGLTYVMALLHGSLKDHEAANSLFQVLRGNLYIDIDQHIKEMDDERAHETTH